MTEIQTIKRVILFKRKTRRVILEEIHNLEFKFALIKIKNELEERMTNNFEPPLSRKLDCITYLLEESEQ